MGDGGRKEKTQLMGALACHVMAPGRPCQDLVRGTWLEVAHAAAHCSLWSSFQPSTHSLLFPPPHRSPSRAGALMTDEDESLTASNRAGRRKDIKARMDAARHAMEACSDDQPVTRSVCSSDRTRWKLSPSGVIGTCMSQLFHIECLCNICQVQSLSLSSLQAFGLPET